MIIIQNEWPNNREHCVKLLAFGCKVLATCHSLGIVPILTGSLAVFAYTRDQTMMVNDIDLACSELAFPKISHRLGGQGIRSVLKEWHVLQLHRDGLKVEFDAVEHWLTGLPDDQDQLQINGIAFRLVGLSGLKELYQRGLTATDGKDDAIQRAKHLAIMKKYQALCAVKG